MVNTILCTLVSLQINTYYPFPPVKAYYYLYCRCGHCKKLLPIFDEVAATLSDQPHYNIGKLDATKYPKTAEIYDVKLYPTIIYFKNGLYGKYEGARNTHSIIQFLYKLSLGEYITINNKQELLIKIKEFNYAFILYIPPPPPPIPPSQSSTPHNSDPSYAEYLIQWKYVFEELARRKHTLSHFILYTPTSPSDDALDLITGSTHTNTEYTNNNNNNSNNEYTIRLIHLEHNHTPIPFHPPPPPPPKINTIVMDKPEFPAIIIPTLSDLEVFVDLYSRPLLSVIDSHNFKRLASLNTTLCLLVVDYNSTTIPTSELLLYYEHIITTTPDLSRLSHKWQTTPDLNSPNNKGCIYGHVDGIKWKRFFSQYGVYQLPSLVLLNVGGEEYYTKSITYTTSTTTSTATASASTTVDSATVGSSAVGTINEKSQNYDPNSSSITKEDIHTILYNYIITNKIILIKYIPKTFIQKIYNTIYRFYPWSLLLFTPLILLVVIIMTPSPDADVNKRKKRD